MQDPQADFVQMVMDRLHALEVSNDQLNERVLRLEARQCMDSRCRRFDDGLFLWFGLTKRPDGMGDPRMNKLFELDAAHLDATAFWGQKRIDMHTQAHLYVGSTGRRTTVKDLLEAINSWCARRDGESTMTNVDRYLDWAGSEHFCHLLERETSSSYAMRHSRDLTLVSQWSFQ